MRVHASSNTWRVSPDKSPSSSGQWKDVALAAGLDPLTVLEHKRVILYKGEQESSDKKVNGKESYQRFRQQLDSNANKF